MVGGEGGLGDEVEEDLGEVGLVERGEEDGFELTQLEDLEGDGVVGKEVCKEGVDGGVKGDLLGLGVQEIGEMGERVGHKQ